jgi:hypothetical protein
MIKYFGDFRQAMITNINLGGDNCNRAVIIGFLLGCIHSESIPDEWIKGLHNHEQLQQLITETTQHVQNSGAQLNGFFLTDGKSNLCNLKSNYLYLTMISKKLTHYLVKSVKKDIVREKSKQKFN